MASSVPGDVPLYKILLVGDSGVGKSCLLIAFTEHTFNEEQPTTIGVDFKLKHVCLGEKTVRLSIWDTAGQERFRTLTSSYYRGAHGVILAYDVTCMESFEHIQEWLNEIDVYATNKNMVKMLVGNKIDGQNEIAGRVVSRERGQEFARRQNMLFMETSAKTREGLEEAFTEMSRKIDELNTAGTGADGSAEGGGIRLQEGEEENGYCWC